MLSITFATAKVQQKFGIYKSFMENFKSFEDFA